ncbi:MULTISPECIES: hypothetical protein [Legionella]|uniref:Uncharacterized protein n=1 Tax=Legionella resiliens TaxID=2905958 RepID=A0ABS8X134_9GAMM|nr:MULTISPECIES: hypothetical protein [unclassified Legionella]MCE0723297.1 hypothetical protein [Legionella sp. 9fVS26]MCE3532450.1 hypothetical protein [Legionella sp. 8cVS16]QLZ68590.1 hypothetical protein FOLKNPGA_01369 [Legionella sp. PC1000]
MSSIASAASFSLDNLVKVTPKNDTQCIQYYLYKGVLYCDTTKTDTQTVDPEIKNYEQLNIVFDDRPWQMAWGNKNSIGTTIEYIPAGDNINDWNELVTSQFFPGLQKKMTLKQFANTMVENVKSLGYQPIVNYHEDTEDRVILEMRIEKPQNQVQDELEMFLKDDQGIYLLHYVTKKADMGNEHREQWLHNLRNSRKLKSAPNKNNMQ